MSKYTDEELKDMALVVFEDRAGGGDQSFQLIITVSTLTGLDPNVVMEKIDDYARS